MGHIAGAEQIAEREIVALVALLVIERGFIAGDQAASALYKIADLAALRIGKSRDIRQQKQLVLVDARIEHLVVHHLEGNPGLDQCLVHAVDGLLDQALYALRPGVEESCLLRKYATPTRAIGAVLRKYGSTL